MTRLPREAEERATDLISRHRDVLDRLVAVLLEHETVDGDTVYRLLESAVPPVGDLPALASGHVDGGA